MTPNRQQRRAQEARARLEANNERVMRQVNEANEAAAAGERFRMLLFAMVREQGRVVIRRDLIDALGENDRLDFAVRPNGDVVAEYRSGTVPA